MARVHCRYVSARPGFSVVAVADNGTEALRLIEDLQPTLLLLDLGLPGGDGIALLRRVRLAGRPVEVIVITAHASPKVVQAAVQLGVVDLPGQAVLAGAAWRGPRCLLHALDQPHRPSTDPDRG